MFLKFLISNNAHLSDKKTLLGVKMLLLSYFIFISYGFSQSTYTPVLSSGIIPSEFRAHTTEKIKTQQKNNGNNYSSIEQTRLKKYYIESNELVDELLFNGNVLFGDTFSNYINAIADRLLKNDTILRNEIHFHAIKSEKVNAFATGTGHVFVTMGLLSRLTDESQLALVIAHEIVHIEKKHTLKRVLATAKIETDARRANIYNNYIPIQLLSVFSVEAEYEADSLGFKRLVEAGYNPQTAVGLFDIMQWGFAPIMEISFSPSLLTIDTLLTPSSFLIHKLSPKPTLASKADDPEYTHPHFTKRKNKFMNWMKTQKPGLTLEPERSKQVFSNTIKAAQKELIRLELREKSYFMALYNSMGLLNNNSNDQYFEEAIGKALYGLAKYKNQGLLDKCGIDTSETYGHFQNCNYYITQLGKKQLNLIAWYYLFNLEKKYHNPFISDLKNDILLEGVRENGFGKKSFFDDLQKCLLFNKDLLRQTESVQTSAKKTSAPENHLFAGRFKPALSALIARKELFGTQEKLIPDSNSQLWTNIFHYEILKKIDIEEFKKETSAIIKIENERATQNNKKNSRKNWCRKPETFSGVEKVACVKPYYQQLRPRLDASIFNTEARSILTKKFISTYSSEIELQNEILCTHDIDSNDIITFNIFCALNSWISESASHEKNGITMIGLENEYTRALADKIKTPYVLQSGVVNVTTGSNYLFPGFYFSKGTYFSFRLYNIMTGKAEWISERTFKRSDKIRFVKSVHKKFLNQLVKESVSR